MDAIILAAGRGERLRPLTNTLPKPLIEIHNISLIEMHLHRLAQAGFERVIINLHHLGELIKNKLGDGKRYQLQIHYSIEPISALETAGGIVHALKLINTQKFAVISADIVCDYKFSNLIKSAKSNHIGHLVLIDNPEHHPKGDFSLSKANQLALKNEKSNAKSYTFSGIAWFDKALFETLDPGKRALRPVLEAAILKGQLSAEHHTGLWSDIGSVERLSQARASHAVAEYIDSIKPSAS